MILVDANQLVSAHDAAAAEHEVAKTWFEDVLNRPRASRIAVAVIASLRTAGLKPHDRTHTDYSGPSVAVRRAVACAV